MNVPTVLLIQALAIASVFLIIRYAPTETVQFLARPRGIKPSGREDTYVRTDFLRGTAVAWGISVILFLASVPLLYLSERWPVMHRANQIASAYFFVLMLLGMLAFAVGVCTLWQAIRWRPVTARREE